MADEDTQSREESLWWAVDASSDISLHTATFDEPLEWPDALPWEEFDAGERGDGFPDPDHLSIDMLFPPTDVAAVVDADRAPTSGHPADGDATELQLEPLPDSIWAAEAPAPADSPAPAVAALGGAPAGGARPDAGTVAVPTFYAEAERASGSRWPNWLAVPRGNAAVVALISFVSLVLLGMFLSVRARNDVPTGTSRSTAPQADIAATRPLNTIPSSTATTTAPPPSINLSELVPPSEEPAADTGAAGAAGAGTTPRTAAPATTAPRSAAPAGGGGGTAPQPTTATTAAPEPPPDATPPPTSPSSNGTTQPTRRSTSTSVDIPRTTVTMPTMPSITRPAINWPPDYQPNG